MYEFSAGEIEDATDGFSPSRVIGKGSHGSVYSGVLKDGRRVAVKRQSAGLHGDSKLRNEALILSLIPPNPCTLSLVGATPDKSLLVTDYMPNGTLHHLLHLSPAPPPWPLRLRIALQLATALRRLHDSLPAIIHRDVKPANILLDAGWNARLADFGLAVACCRGGGAADSMLPAGTIGYIDPTYTTPNMLSATIDVYSFGVVLLELVSARRAIDVAQSPASIVEWAVPLIQQGRGLEICDKRVRSSSIYTRHVVMKMVGVAARCVGCHRHRPSMGEVVSSLQLTTTMDYVREMVRSMMRRKKSRFSGAIVTRTTTAACATAANNNNNLSKGRLLVREILADITFK